MITAEEQSRITLSVAAVATGFILVALSSGIRFYVRINPTRKLWWDDYSMMGALALCAAIAFSDILGIIYGSGKRQHTLDSNTITLFIKNLYAKMILWCAGVFLIKVGILLLYWRLFPTARCRAAIGTLLGLTVGIFVSNLAAFILQCVPIPKFWDPTLPGTCFNQNDFYLASAIINIVQDFAILLLPIPVVWGLHMVKYRKASLSILFLMGILVCIASAFRIVSIFQVDPTDFTFTNIGCGLWSSIEADAALFCSNLVVVMPRIGEWMKPIRSRVFSTRSRRGRPKGSIEIIELGVKSKDSMCQLYDDSDITY